MSSPNQRGVNHQLVVIHFFASFGFSGCENVIGCNRTDCTSGAVLAVQVVSFGQSLALITSSQDAWRLARALCQLPKASRASNCLRRMDSDCSGVGLRLFPFWAQATQISNPTIANVFFTLPPFDL